MGRKIVYIGKKGHFFTENREYDILKRNTMTGDIYVLDDFNRSRAISHDYFSENFRHVTLNEEMQGIKEEQREFRINCLEEELRQQKKIDFYVGILCFVETAILFGIFVKYVLS